MIRLAASLFLLTLAGSVAAPCFAADKTDANGDGSVTVSFTKADGAEAMIIKGPESIIIAQSLTLSDGGKTMKVTPHGKGIEMRFGTHVIRATELQFGTMPPIKTMEVLKIQMKSKR
ncbi:MAG: hypothetical protein ACQESR_30200 [Planctomycetota bacterium]